MATRVITRNALLDPRDFIAACHFGPGFATAASSSRLSRVTCRSLDTKCCASDVVAMGEVSWSPTHRR